jgi:hypothetical protein
VRKQQLYDYIEDKINAKKIAIRKEYAKQNHALVDRYLQCQGGAIKAASSLCENFKSAIGLISDPLVIQEGYNIRNMVQYIQQTGNFYEKLRRGLYDALDSTYQIKSDKMGLIKNSDLLLEQCKAHNRLSMKYNKDYDACNVLERELKSVVYNYPAKQAYSELERLGLNMSDFAAEESTTIAPLELSVPIDFLKVGEAE